MILLCEKSWTGRASTGLCEFLCGFEVSVGFHVLFHVEMVGAINDCVTGASGGFLERIGAAFNLCTFTPVSNRIGFSFFTRARLRFGERVTASAVRVSVADIAAGVAFCITTTPFREKNAFAVTNISSSTVCVCVSISF